MIEKSVLLGNGLNIEFSDNDEYKNYSIIQRMCNNLSEENRYDDVFAGTIKASDMFDFMENLNKWFKEHALRGIEALKWIENKDELCALLEMSKRYSKTDPNVFDIGLEDYLLAAKLFNATYADKGVNYNTLYQGIKILMLDAIYNEGKIEHLHTKMNSFKKELSKFHNIFTLNYDTNVESLIGEPIYHLHGSFANLHHEYREDTLKGWLLTQLGKELVPYIKGKEYLYCDAVFGFSGKNKMERIEQYNEVYTNTAILNIAQKHPELKMPKYPIEKFKRISGELHLMGVCPNNDSHIFKMINDNPNIKRILYYSACDADSQKIQNILNKPIQIINVFKYWKKIR